MACDMNIFKNLKLSNREGNPPSIGRKVADTGNNVTEASPPDCSHSLTDVILDAKDVYVNASKAWEIFSNSVNLTETGYFK
jgi:hypothetical protein